MAHPDLSHSSWVPALWLQHSRVQWAVCQCLWLMEQRLLRKCKYPFIAPRNFVICPTAGEGKADNHLFCRQNLGSASLQLPVLLAGFLQWVPGAQTMRREGREGRQRLEREELNLQTTSQLVVAGWEQELPHVPGFYLLTNSSQRLQHSQWGRTVSRVCWDIAGFLVFFSVVIGSFLLFSRKGTTCLICPAHPATGQRHPGTGGGRFALGEAVQEKNFQLLLSLELLCYR